MQPANQALFDDPKECSRLKALASGVDFEQQRVRGGVSFVTEDKLRPGEIIYRVGHSGGNPEGSIHKNMTSSWWMRSESFLHIMKTAETAESNPQERYRMKCAVAYDFGVERWPGLSEQRFGLDKWNVYRVQAAAICGKPLK